MEKCWVGNAVVEVEVYCTLRMNYCVCENLAVFLILIPSPGTVLAGLNKSQNGESLDTPNDQHLFLW